jgi:hypothetical protein
MLKLFALACGILAAGALMAGPMGYGQAPFVTSTVIACVNAAPYCAGAGTSTPNQAVSSAGTLIHPVTGDSVAYTGYAGTQYGVMHIAASSTIDLDDNKGWSLGLTGFQETMTINAPGKSGQQGVLKYSYHIDGSTFSSDPTVNHAFLQVITRVWSEYNGQALQNSVQDFTGAHVDTTYHIPQNFYFTFGTPFYMYFSMQATTGSFTITPGTGGYNVNSNSTGIASASVNFHNTFVLNGLEVQDLAGQVLNATYESGSGTSYSADGVAPEPSTWALAGGALLYLGWLKRRRR